MIQIRKAQLLKRFNNQQMHRSIHMQRGKLKDLIHKQKPKLRTIIHYTKDSPQRFQPD
jgi:hypothetical protein